METKLSAFILRNVHLCILGSALTAFLVALTTLGRFDASRLEAFGPTAHIYFDSVKSGLLIATIILFVSFVATAFFGKSLKEIQIIVKNFYLSLSTNRKNILVLLICIVFSFATHAGNIPNGYFNMDDFEVMRISHTASFTQSLLIPHGNDHTIPLFTAEIKMLDTAFGQNEIPYNIFFFLLFALIPFFTYLTFKRLEMSTMSWVVFLLLFSGATGWAEMLTGFYIMSIYFQIILFFSIASWAYVAWTQTKKKRYVVFFAASLIGALTADTSGIWVLPAIFLLILHSYWIQHESLKMRMTQFGEFLKENRAPLISLFGITTAFALFLFVTFTILQPHTFLSTLSDSGTSLTSDKKESWRFVPLTENFFSFFSSGVSLTIIAPDAVKILAHPAIQGHAKTFWPIVELLILGINAILFWTALKYARNKEKKLILLLLALMFITISMVIVARPNHEIIPDFDYRYAGAPFYFYCFFLAVCASMLARKRAYATKIIFSIVLVLVATQQAFSFHAVRIQTESTMRKEVITHLQENLLTELDVMSREETVTTLPNLTGEHIFPQTMAGFTLADYILFFDKKMPLQLIQNAEMAQDIKTQTVTTVSSLRSSTDKTFLNALKSSPTIRRYYASPALMSYRTMQEIPTPVMHLAKKESEGTLIHQNRFDPEKKSIVGLTFSTDNTPGNLEITFSFQNDFDVTGNTGRIRIDDYTSFTLQEGRRVYHIETDLLQLYVYALSEKVSNVVLHTPKTKNASVSALSFK